MFSEYVLLYRIDRANESSPYSHQRDDRENDDSSDGEYFHQFVYGVLPVSHYSAIGVWCYCGVCFFNKSLHICLNFVPQQNGWSIKESTIFDRLPVIGIDETVHDHPAHEDPPDEPHPGDQAPVFPEPQHVLREDDIIGARASIVHDDCLRQLATYLILPVDKCTGVLKTGMVCDCVPPFEINITSKGTAMC